MLDKVRVMLTMVVVLEIGTIVSQLMLNSNSENIFCRIAKHDNHESVNYKGTIWIIGAVQLETPSKELIKSFLEH